MRLAKKIRHTKRFRLPLLVLITVIALIGVACESDDDDDSDDSGGDCTPTAEEQECFDTCTGERGECEVSCGPDPTGTVDAVCSGGASGGWEPIDPEYTEHCSCLEECYTDAATCIDACGADCPPDNIDG